MRCSTAAILALVMHPDYRQREGIMEEAMAMATAHFRKQLDCTFIINMPVENAQAILEPEIPRLIKTQRPSGTWKIKDNRRISYGVLKALKHCGYLASLLEEGNFRRDPFQSFCSDDDYYGFVVRRNIMESPSADDSSLQEQLASDIFTGQAEDGSWNGTVISTSNQMETLLELGIGADDERIQKGADWLLSMCDDDVYRESRNLGGFLVGHHMFSSQDRSAEFRSALAEKSEWNPVGLCYRHLPMIQTGYALRTLIKLGLENDERVMASCDNFLELRQTYGGWCDTNIRNGLVRTTAAQRKPEGEKAGKPEGQKVG
ncbi:hypothetical protein ACFL6S_32320 [Candidatus Poribacteria bacterium]